MSVLVFRDGGLELGARLERHVGTTADTLALLEQGLGSEDGLLAGIPCLVVRFVVGDVIPPTRLHHTGRQTVGVSRTIRLHRPRHLTNGVADLLTSRGRSRGLGCRGAAHIDSCPLCFVWG